MFVNSTKLAAEVVSLIRHGQTYMYYIHTESYRYFIHGIVWHGMVVFEKTWITSEVWVCILQLLVKSWPGPYTGLGLSVLLISLAL